MLSIFLAALVALLVAPPAFGGQQVPEKLVYDLSWTGIPVGTATQEITEEGAQRRIVSTAISNDWLSAFFPVNDRTESLLQKKEGQFPGESRHFRMVMKEGRHIRNREITYDQAAGKAHFHDQIDGEQVDVPIPKDTFDIYASFYFVRHEKLEPGKSVFINVLDSKKLHRIEVRGLRRERIKVPAGVFNTIVIEPMVKSEGIFEGKRGAYIWLTDDDRRIPVKAQTKVRVGSVTAELTGVSY